MKILAMMIAGKEPVFGQRVPPLLFGIVLSAIIWLIRAVRVFT